MPDKPSRATKSNSLIAGQKFSNWTVLEHTSGPSYKCKCDCGREKIVSSHDLLKGKSRRCRSCAVSISSTKHGHSTYGKTSGVYSSYNHMVSRCTKPEDKDYHRYGGRGIQVCAMWLESFEAFLLCMGPKPDKSFSIERLDSNGNYEPSNCIWADKPTQNRNKTTSIKVTYDGECKTVAEWARDPRALVTAAVAYKRIAAGENAGFVLFGDITVAPSA